MTKLKQWFHKRALRRSQERYAYYKGRREAAELMLKEGNYDYRMNPFNRHRFIRLAGKEALYLERTEILLRAK